MLTLAANPTTIRALTLEVNIKSILATALYEDLKSIRKRLGQTKTTRKFVRRLTKLPSGSLADLHYCLNSNLSRSQAELYDSFIAETAKEARRRKRNLDDEKRREQKPRSKSLPIHIVGLQIAASIAPMDYPKLISELRRKNGQWWEQTQALRPLPTPYSTKFL